MLDTLTNVKGGVHYDFTFLTLVSV